MPPADLSMALPTEENGPPADASMKIWLTILAMASAGAASNSVYLCFTSIAMESAEYYGATLLEVNSLAAWANVATACGYPVAAVVLDQFGIGPAFTAGTLLAVTGCCVRVFSASIQSFPLLFVGQFIAIFGSSFHNILAPKFAVRHIPANMQGLAIGFGLVGNMVGSYGGPTLGVAFRADTGHLLWAQLALTGLAIPMIPLFLSSQYAMPTAENSHTPGSSLLGDLYLRTVRCFSIRGMSALVVGSGAIIGIFDAFAGVLEEVGTAMPGTDLTWQLTCILTFGCVLGCLLAGPVADKVGWAQTLTASTVLGLLGWIVCWSGMRFAQPSALETGWGVVAFLHGGCVYPLAVMLGSQAAPGIEGTATAYVTMSSDVMSVISQSITAKLLSDTSRHMVLPCIAGWTALAFVSAIPLLHAASVLQCTNGEGEMLLKKEEKRSSGLEVP